MRARRERKVREHTRPIERLVDAGDEDGLQRALRKLNARWGQISQKLNMASLRVKLRTPSYSGSWTPEHRELILKTPALTDDEAHVLWDVLRLVMQRLPTEESRRRRRDAMVALDFIYHRETLKHDRVMPGVCARWGVSESTVKAAVKRQRATALRHLRFERRLFSGEIPGTRPYYPDEMPKPKTFEDHMRFTLDTRAREYRERGRLRPRAAAGGSVRRRGDNDTRARVSNTTPIDNPLLRDNT